MVHSPVTNIDDRLQQFDDGEGHGLVKAGVLWLKNLQFWQPWGLARQTDLTQVMEQQACAGGGGRQ